MGAKRLDNLNLSMTSEFQQFTVIIDMVLKRAKCDLNGVKVTIVAAKSQKSVRRLNSNGLYSTGPKLDNFCAKNTYFWFKPPLF